MQLETFFLHWSLEENHQAGECYISILTTTIYRLNNLIGSTFVGTYKSPSYICGGQLVSEHFVSLFCWDFCGNGVLTLNLIFPLENLY
jgi:hypothetical protein